MDTVILIALNLLPIAVFLAFLPWVLRKGARNPHFLNVPGVTMVAALALMNLRTSHFATYIKIFAALFAIIMWFLAYRFREQGPVVGAVLVGLAAIMILSGA